LRYRLIEAGFVNELTPVPRSTVSNSPEYVLDQARDVDVLPLDGMYL
jgi:hypothetical protein